MKDHFNFQEIIDNLPIVSSNRNYWLVRTSSGSNYESFLKYNFIAIGWNEINLTDLNQIHLDPKNKEIKKRVKEKIHYEIDLDEGKPNRGIKAYQSKAVGQLMKFTYEIKEGDIVVIPSDNSDFLSFGEVASSITFLASDIELHRTDCVYRKRKEVHWIKINTRRDNLESNLYRFIFAHQTINNITQYADHINSTLFDFYSIDGRATLVLRLKKQTSLDAFKMQTLYNDLVDFIGDFSEFNGEKIEENSLSVKFDLQSPGLIILSGLLIGGMILTAFCTVLAGGEHKINVELGTWKFNSTFKSDSLLDKFTKFLDASLERKIRASRLITGLKYFEIQPNKNMDSLPVDAMVNLTVTEMEESNQNNIDPQVN